LSSIKSRWRSQVPEGKVTKENLFRPEWKKLLDKKVLGIEEAKTRLLQLMAAQKRGSGRARRPIVIYGPSSLGKKTLCRAIGELTGRPLVLIPSGTVQEASSILGDELRPGILTRALISAKCMNPIILIDRVDRVEEASFSVLMEAVTQHTTQAFLDHFLGIYVDMSQVQFILTASDPPPSSFIREIESVPIYCLSMDEKIRLFKKVLHPAAASEVGMTPLKMNLKDIRILIENYTREAGIGELDQTINKIYQSLNFRKLSGEAMPRQIDAGLMADILMDEAYHSLIRAPHEPGCITALAATNDGGVPLPFHCFLHPGNGNILFTGNMSQVMRESAVVAWDYFRYKFEDSLESQGVDLNDYNIHVSASDLSSEKDGPSAGMAMVVMYASAFFNRRVRKQVTMTGEVDLSGRALPIGYLREKLTAALECGFKEVLIPQENVIDLPSVPAEVRRKLSIIPIKTADEAVVISLQPLRRRKKA